jgi:transposase
MAKKVSTKSLHYYVGLDVHLFLTAVCIMNAAGKIVHESKIKGHSDEVCKFLKSFFTGRDATFDVTFEACDGYGMWYEKLSRIARQVIVAHPSHLNSIWNTKTKNDRIDAEKLAKLLMLDIIPAVHVPHIDVRDWRMTIQHRRYLVSRRTSIKNRLRAVLRRNHIKAPRNLWSQKNMQWLTEVALPCRGEILQRDMLLADLTHIEKQICICETELDERAENSIAVRLLKTIPGIGNRTAEAVVAWIDDANRFTRVKQVGAYFGLAVSEDTSAGKRRQGHITKEGPSIVRAMLTEVTWQMSRNNPAVKMWLEKYKRNDKKRNFIAAVAMLKNGEVWNPNIAA